MLRHFLFYFNSSCQNIIIEFEYPRLFGWRKFQLWKREIYSFNFNLRMPSPFWLEEVSVMEKRKLLNFVFRIPSPVWLEEVPFMEKKKLL